MQNTVLINYSKTAGDDNVLMSFLSFSDNLLQDLLQVLFVLQKSVDNFEILSTKHAQFRFGVHFPL